MNTVRNLPVLLRGTEEGGFIAECLLLPDCRCFGATRQPALETMQTLVISALRTQRINALHYEIVHLAIGRVSTPPVASTTPSPSPPTLISSSSSRSSSEPPTESNIA